MMISADKFLSSDEAERDNKSIRQSISQLQVDAPNMGQVKVSQVKSQALLSV